MLFALDLGFVVVDFVSVSGLVVYCWAFGLMVGFIDVGGWLRCVLCYC